jgi:hypothetical protein
MAKGGLSNQLLGKMIVPKPEYGSTASKDDVNGRIWVGLRPNLSGEMLATIDAAWVDGAEGIKLAVHDVHGNTRELYLTQVRLKGETC